MNFRNLYVHPYRPPHGRQALLAWCALAVQWIARGLRELKTSTKLALAALASFAAAVCSNLAALMNASFAFGVGQEWRTPVAYRWAYGALALLALAIGLGLAVPWRAWRGRRNTWRVARLVVRDRNGEVVANVQVDPSVNLELLLT
jgi:hypothetical protein